MHPLSHLTLLLKLQGPTRLWSLPRLDSDERGVILSSLLKRRSVLCVLQALVLYRPVHTIAEGKYKLSKRVSYAHHLDEVVEMPHILIVLGTQRDVSLSLA